MATSISYGDSLTEQTYRTGVTLAAQLQTYCFNFAGPDDSAAAMPILEREGNGRGDTVNIRFHSINYDEEPKTRMSQVLGQESSTDYHEDSINLRYFLMDGGVENVPSDQNHVSFDVKKGEIERIARQWAYLFDKWFIYHLAGYTPANTADDYGLSGGNIVTEHDSNHEIFVGSGNSSAANVGADNTAVLTTDVLSDAVNRLTSRTFVNEPAAPCTTPFGENFVAMVGPVGWQQLRENSSSTDFYDLARAGIEGGDSFAQNPLITGEGMIYDNILILKSDFLPRGVTSDADEANTFKAVVFGARAMHVVFGSGYTKGNHLGWSEHMQHRRWSCLADTIGGMKRTIVDGESWASMAITHYSAT